MPTVVRTLTALIALLFISACTTAPRISSQAMPRVDFNEFQTFGWVDQLGTNFGSDEETRMTRRFKVAVQREMEAMGFRLAESDPDLLVNFFVNANEQQATYTRANLTTPTGYFDYRYGMYTAWPTYRISVQDVDYAVGTTTIDVVDAAERQLIWEGRIEGRLTQRALVNPGAAVSDAVSQIFARFPTRNPRRPDARSN